MALGAADLGDTMGLDPAHARPSYDNQLLLFSSDRLRADREVVAFRALLA
ncbi:MAG: hypothetical protein HY908_37335 [Myxococcales bacterium]|nr:hypothetical protein [Myxococcales bacterium]